jgi:Protein of unknown function (DUF3551)
MHRMRSGIIVLATIVAAMMATSAAHADPYKWCAIYAGNRGDGGTNCGFITYKQCLDTISGIGGICSPNPFYTDPEAQPRKRKRRK